MYNMYLLGKKPIDQLPLLACHVALHPCGTPVALGVCWRELQSQSEACPHTSIEDAPMAACCLASLAKAKIETEK